MKKLFYTSICEILRLMFLCFVIQVVAPKNTTPFAIFSMANAQSELQPQKSNTIVFLGDSLTAGFGLAQAEAFPAKIDEIIKKQKFVKQWRVINAGVSGDTSAGGLARLNWIYKSKPQILFICLGANDGLRGLKISATEKNLDAILMRAQQEKTQVVFAGMELPRNYGKEYEKEFLEIFPRLARKYKVPFMPFLLQGMAMNADLTLPDRVHPNAQGAAVIANQVWAVLAPVLRRFEN